MSVPMDAFFDLDSLWIGDIVHFEVFHSILSFWVLCDAALLYSLVDYPPFKPCYPTENLVRSELHIHYRPNHPSADISWNSGQQSNTQEQFNWHELITKLGNEIVRPVLTHLMSQEVPGSLSFISSWHVILTSCDMIGTLTTAHYYILMFWWWASHCAGRFDKLVEPKSFNIHLSLLGYT